MSQALAGDRDLTTTAWSVSTLRDYFLTLINANDARYRQEHACLRDLIGALDVRYEQRFKAQEVATILAREAMDEVIRISGSGAHELLLAHEKQDMTEHISQAALLNKTIDGLRAETSTGMNNLKDILSRQSEATERAMAKADMANDKRFDGVNEFRNTLGDQQRLLMPRQEVEVTLKAAGEKIDALGRTIREQNERIVALAAAQAGKQEGQHAGWTWAVSVIGLVISVVSLMSLLSARLLIK